MALPMLRFVAFVKIFMNTGGVPNNCKACQLKSDTETANWITKAAAQVLRRGLFSSRTYSCCFVKIVSGLMQIRTAIEFFS